MLRKRNYVVVAFLMTLTLTVKAQRVLHAQKYKLVWADEFAIEGKPDSANWKYEHGFVRNNELQWYQPQNAWCEDGKLIIEARKEDRLNPLYNAQSSDWKASRPNIEYTAASLNTRGLHSWKYGRFIMRAKIDAAPGLWPAFWTLGVKGEWPSNGEIDIMEFYQDKILANIAVGTKAPFQAKWFSKTKSLRDFNDPQWADKFHTWRMDWDEVSIGLYVDDELLNKVDRKALLNDDGSNINPFLGPHYILLNFALGGDNGGDVSKTPFPRRFEIDYVRVYQKIP